MAPVKTKAGLVELGELSEWLKEHAWKVCIRQRIEGSNPSLSAINKAPVQGAFNCCFYTASENAGFQLLTTLCEVLQEN